jgi:hypothetical protein
MESRRSASEKLFGFDLMSTSRAWLLLCFGALA